MQIKVKYIKYFRFQSFILVHKFDRENEMKCSSKCICMHHAWIDIIMLHSCKNTCIFFWQRKSYYSDFTRISAHAQVFLQLKNFFINASFFLEIIGSHRRVSCTFFGFSPEQILMGKIECRTCSSRGCNNGFQEVKKQSRHF